MKYHGKGNYQRNAYRARDVCTREAEQDNYNRYR